MRNSGDTNYWTSLVAGRLKRRRLLALTAVGAGSVAATAIACGGGQKTGRQASPAGAASSPGTPRSGGVLNVYLAANYLLDAQKSSAAAQRTIGGVQSRVFRFKTGLDPKVGEDHVVENDLGLSAESPDAVTWTVKLRPDAKFHNTAPVNGHAVEAEDIKATFTRALDPATQNPNLGQLGMIDPGQISTPDKNTVVFRLNYPYAPFTKMLASASYAWIYPREVLSGSYDPAKTVIGSGPFTLDSVTPDVALVYKKNPAWFEKGLPYVDTIRAAIVPDANQRLAQFTAGNLDELLLDDPNSLDAAQRGTKAAVMKTENAVPHALFLNVGVDGSPFQDIRVRRAFSMALDRDAISKAVYNGQAEQVVLIPSYMGKWSLKVQDLPADTQQYFKYNPAEAKKLLEAAGHSNLEIKFGYTNTFTPVDVKQVESLNNMLNAAGIKTSIFAYDYTKDFIAGGKGIRSGFYPSNEVAIASSPGFTDADEWIFSFFASKSTTNTGNVRTPELDAMIAKERTLLNDDERVRSVLDIQKYVAQQMYQVPTVGTYQWTFVSPRVQSYQHSTTNGVMTETYAKLWLNA
jgi:peptide/nickel transport system substrate-binding protein